MIITHNQLMVIVEQKRQRTEEGYTVATDRINGGTDALAQAAACYAAISVRETRAPAEVVWPWAEGTFKPRSVRENLIRAGALILSALDADPNALYEDGAGPENVEWCGLLTGCKVLSPSRLEEIYGSPSQNVIAMNFDPVTGTRQTFQLLISYLDGHEKEYLVDLDAMGHIAEHLTDQVRRYAGAPELPDLVDFINRQKAFSEQAFGPGERTNGVLDHIAKESEEVRANPGDASEWADMILLSLDGAWRAGHTAEEITKALTEKLAKNERRDWPDWRTSDPEKAIEHVRGKED